MLNREQVAQRVPTCKRHVFDSSTSSGLGGWQARIGRFGGQAGLPPPRHRPPGPARREGNVKILRFY
jgi:hypothetical protein